MNSIKILKSLLILGGIMEIIVGVLFMVLDIFLKQIGFQNLPIFSQIAGSFFFCYGILLVYSSRDLEKFFVIPLINILFRIIVIVFAIINLIIFPEFLLILIFAIVYDLLWSIIYLAVSTKLGLIFKKK